VKRFAFLVAAGLLAAGNLLHTPAAQAQSKDEQEIRALEDNFALAVKAKNLDAIMKMYVPGNELFVFDISPPRQYVGFDAYRKDWKSFLDMVKGPIGVEISDLSITSDGKLGYSHSIQHLSGRNADGSGFEFTARVTDCYRKVDGKWLVTVESVSVPVDLATGKADLASKP
jgi:ketosteroid isomerase-like protein